MPNRIVWYSAVLVSTLIWTGSVAAQGSQSSTSGPSAGSSVVPSTAVQDKFEGRSATKHDRGELHENLGAPTAAGAPGVEGKPGTQSGPSVR
jgi:hypothetical protein